MKKLLPSASKAPLRKDPEQRPRRVGKRRTAVVVCFQFIQGFREATMAAEGRSCSSHNDINNQQTGKRPRSIFDLPYDFFDSCRLIATSNREPSIIPQPHDSSLSATEPLVASSIPSVEETLDRYAKLDVDTKCNVPKWSCNTCKLEFESLQDQRSHFKSDLHRLNVKLSLAGKDILKEEDFDELTSDCFPEDFDISSISGSEDEDDKGLRTWNSVNDGSSQSAKHKLVVRLSSGERVSLWKSFIFNDSENISHEIDLTEKDSCFSCPRETALMGKLKALVHKPRNNTNLRVVLLASGGHFAGCVFDGSTVIAHKTFHRYVVRAKSGKKQSSKDASGKSAHSAGASLRRYNELALKKGIQELIALWKPYFDASSCVFIYAPSNNRQLFYNGDKPVFSDKPCDVRSIPLTVRRPTFKEALRVYSQLSQVTYELDEKEFPNKDDWALNDRTVIDFNPRKENARDEPRICEETCSSSKKSDEQSISGESEGEFSHTSTALHEAAKSGNAQHVLELLDHGLDPSIKDERGKTPYMLATDKEVRNAFRRFMALNLDRWDWHAANVPSALTKEMEQSQAAKQAEKNAKRKAKSKELKKLRKVKEKKAQAQAAETQNVATVSENLEAIPPPVRQSRSQINEPIPKEEELKRKQEEDREKRAAAAERRIAAAQQMASTTILPSTSQPKGSIAADSSICCSCCKASLAGKIPFHRYNYKYCSSSCMHEHSAC
ncbi:hypothetical protein Nepgr_002412 [Nepenthes gracilis]|uniref:VLRF1 domain-containing protein n=1 Tax=Nepenthes gracilis TaxID=150966 RepID=A0AAD3RY84_NEPGR|nr:hypothetical protein Nepgr_002412 [Nepenthes gracilis]